jgi:hypothetical protein
MDDLSGRAKQKRGVVRPESAKGVDIATIRSMD